LDDAQVAGLSRTLAGRWALVTGGHVRVGRAISLALAEAGMNVLVTYRTSPAAAERTVAELKALGIDARAFEVDLADAAAVVQLADAVLAQADPSLAVVVNSASVYPRTVLGEISAETWDAIFAANLRAPFLLSQRLGLAMKAGGGGHIVNLGDWAGLRPYRSYLPYVVSKAGLIHMTRALALELAPEVQVNCVCPGPVLLPEHYDAATAEAVRRATPLERLGDPGEIARAVRFFVESGFATGAILTVDGGRLIA
jgi:pteridine reductase